MKTCIFVFLVSLSLSPVVLTAQSTQSGSSPIHPFPALKYEYSALEPYIDSTTMSVHYNRHYRGYYNNFLKAIEGTPLADKTVEEILAQVSKHSTAIRNNGGGYYNHLLFWENMSPNGGQPSAELQKAIVKRFGSMEAFQKEFAAAALSVFGSGWAWLILSENNELAVVTSSNQDSPMMDVAPVKGKPLLALDVWEHAYYLKYQNKRVDYIESFWKVVDWQTVSNRYKTLKK